MRRNETALAVTMVVVMNVVRERNKKIAFPTIHAFADGHVVHRSVLRSHILHVVDSHSDIARQADADLN